MTKVELAEKQRRYRAEHPGYERAIKVKRYGITPEEYGQMVLDRGGRCDICGEVPEKSLHIDHDHSCCPGRNACGQCIRGLLCSRCNLALGGFRDNPELLRIAALYLEGGEA